MTLEPVSVHEKVIACLKAEEIDLLDIKKARESLAQCVAPTACIKAYEEILIDRGKRKLMNLSGMLFTEQGARDYYGDCFDTANLVWVDLDEDGCVI